MKNVLYVLPALVLLGMLSVAYAQQDNTRPEFVSSTIDTITMELNIVFDETIDVSETNLSQIIVYSDDVFLSVDTGNEEFDRDAPDSDTLTVTLDLASDFFDFDTPTGLRFGSNAVKDTSGNGIALAIGLPLTDSTPPSVVSAELDASTRILTVVLDEPVDVSATDTDKISVWSTDSDSFIRVASSFDYGADDSATVSFEVSRDAAASIEVGLDIFFNPGSFTDTDGNTIAVLNRVEASVVADTTPPTLLSVEFDTHTRVLTFTFDETIDASETDASKFSIVNAGSGSWFDIDGTLDTTDDSTAVKFTINQGQADSIGNGRNYGIQPGAVDDTAGNSYSRTKSAPITLTSSDTTPPSVVSATLDTGTRILTVVFDEPIDPNAANRVHYHSGGNFLPVDMDHNGSSPDTLTKDVGEAVLAEIVAQPRVHINAGHVRDTSGNAVGQTDNIPVTVLDTTPPVLLSAEYDPGTETLTLRFDETVDISEVDARNFEINGQLQVNSSGFDGTAPDSDTVTLTDQGSVLGDLQSAVIDIPDSADVQDLSGNKMAVENFAIRFVEPTDTTPPSFVSATLDTFTRVLTLVFDEIIDVSQLDLARITVLGLAENGNTESVNLAFQSSPYVTGNGSDSDTVAIANMSERIFAIHNITGVGTSGGIFDTHGNEIRPQNYPLQTADTQPKPVCTPPASGDWEITQSCMLAPGTSVPAGIVIHAPATLVIPVGVTLDVDLENHGLLIKQGAGLLIESGGRMR